MRTNERPPLVGRALIVTAICVLPACVNGQSEPTDASAEDAVELYVDRLAAGDAAGVDELRCEAQKEMHPIDSVLGIGQKIVDAQGPITQVQSISTAGDASEMSRLFSVSFRDAPAALIMQMAKVGAKWKVCGQQTEESVRVRASFSSTPVVAGPPISRSIEDLLFDTIDAVLGGRWERAGVGSRGLTFKERDPGLVYRSVARWDAGHRSQSVLVGLHVFVDADSALLWMSRASRPLIDNATERLDVVGDADRGLRVLSAYGTAIQASTSPPWSATYFFLYGSTVVTVNVGPYHAEPDTLAEDVAVAVSALLHDESEAPESFGTTRSPYSTQTGTAQIDLELAARWRPPARAARYVNLVSSGVYRHAVGTPGVHSIRMSHPRFLQRTRGDSGRLPAPLGAQRDVRTND